jgi:chitodextrinase
MAPNFQPTFIIDPDLSGLTLQNAKVVTLGWFISESRTITSHSGNQINFAAVWDTPTDASGDNPGVHVRKYYFVTGDLDLLNNEKEWHYDGTYLYFRQPGGGQISGTVEYKARNWGFNLMGKEYINIEGFTFNGCEPATGSESTNYCTVNNVVARYQNHTITHESTYWQGYGNSRQVGVKLLGIGNTVKNSDFRYAGSQAVWIGRQGTVENNYFDYISYDGMWGCPVAFWGMDNVSNITVTKNTMKHTGRSAIDNGFAFVEGEVRNVTNNNISYNDMSYFAMLNQDAGAFYSWGYQNLSGTRIHHNWIHTLAAVKNPNDQYADGIMAGIYFDMGSGASAGQSPLVVDHNAIWDIGESSGLTDLEVADVYELTKMNYSTKQATLWYNNTLWTNLRAYYIGEGTNPSIIRNNISRATFNFFFYPTNSATANIGYGIIQADPNVNTFPGGLPATVHKNTNPLLNGGSLSSPEIYFGLQAGSPAINAGTFLQGYTPASDVDLGAYERDETPWTAGYVAVPFSGVDTPPATNALVKLNLNEANGIAPVNSGSGTATFTRSTTTPASSANVPANVGGANSFDFGTTTGNYYVESTAAIDGLKGLSAFTITGWVNNKNSTEGAGGNRIVSWINNGGNGVDLVYKTDGSLQLGVNAWPDTSPARSSASKVTTNVSAPAGNWIFFAVTYQSSGGIVKFYFGNNTVDATLDVQRTYSQGAVGTAIGKLAIGAFNDATRNASTYDRMFRGLIDDVQIHGSELTLSNIIGIQRGTYDTTPPSAPINLAAPSVGDVSVNLTWSASTDNVAVTGYDIYRGGTTLCGSSTSASFTVTGLTANTAYSFTVKAKDAAGNISPASTPINVTTSTSSLPSPWLTQDIGSVGVAGSASHSGGVFTISGSGADIWNVTDEFRFVYRSLTGDGELTARVATLGTGHVNAKAGVMMRETLTGGSKHAFVDICPLPDQEFLWRATTGSTTAISSSGGVAAPYWVRVKRVGNSFTAYKSSNGTTWVQNGSAQTISMNATIYVGMVVSAHNNSATLTATFDNVTLNTIDNTAPSAPTNLAAPSYSDVSVNLTWSPSTDNVGVTGYDIYRAGTTLCGSTAATSFTVTGLTANTAYSFTVKAKDAANNISAASTPLNVTTSALPSPWQTQNIGSVGVAGSASHSGGVFTISGSGADIWNVTDEFRFVYRSLTGDGELTARVATLGAGHVNAKAGVMMRETLTGGSKHALVDICPLPDQEFLWRTTTGSTTSISSSGGVAAPYWVRVKRVGNSFTAYKSSNGTTWVQNGSAQTISMNATIYVGMVVSAHNNSATLTATFDNVALRDGSGNILARTASAEEEEQKAVVDGITGAKLYQNDPNPFTGKTVVRMYIPASSSSAAIHLFDQFGKEISKIDVIERGDVSVEIGEQLRSGVYLYFFKVDGRQVGMKRMISVN